MATNDDITVDERESPATPATAELDELRDEIERLRLAERVALTARADASIEAATARRSLDRAMGEVEALRGLWSSTQARLDAERLARAADRRRRVDAEASVAAVHGALASAEQRVAQLTHERDTARAEVVAVRSSLSWRVTTPLRHLGLRSVLRRLRR